MKNKTTRRLDKKAHARANILSRILEKGVFTPKGVDLDYLSTTLSKNRGLLEAQYRYLLAEDIRLLGEADLRSGLETYGYLSEEYIKNRFHYISDRADVSFRIRWILDWLDNVALKSNQEAIAVLVE